MKYLLLASMLGAASATVVNFDYDGTTYDYTIVEVDGGNGYDCTNAGYLPIVAETAEYATGLADQRAADALCAEVAMAKGGYMHRYFNIFGSVGNYPYDQTNYGYSPGTTGWAPGGCFKDVTGVTGQPLSFNGHSIDVFSTGSAHLSWSSSDELFYCIVPNTAGDAGAGDAGAGDTGDAGCVYPDCSGCSPEDYINAQCCDCQ